MASKREEERNEKIIRGLMKLPPNRRCINCNSLGPQYVCTNFWTFVCMICSGIHREFTHRVKSVSMSKFTSQEVEALQNGGNQRAREIYLKDFDLQRERLPNSSNVDKVREFIKAVYVDRKYGGLNKSDKPPTHMQGENNVADEIRRVSSYHSYSQSPPYDFQYEDRLKRKQGGPIAKKPGSGLYERKAVSFAYSPGRFSDHMYDDRFANERSSSRVSDYSVSSGGDPFRSAPQSPNPQKNEGFSSPTVDLSREIVDGVQRQATSTHIEAATRRDTDKIPLPRPQRAVSAVGFGSFDSNCMPHQSVGSGSLFDAFSESNHSATTTQSKVPAFPAFSQPSTEDSGTLNLFEDPFGMVAPNLGAGVDVFQAPTGSVSSMDLFQTSTEPSAVLQPQTSLSSSSSYFNEISQKSSLAPFVPSVSQKLPEPSDSSNEGWATFDLPQQNTSIANAQDTAVLGAHSETGFSFTNTGLSSPGGMQWADFENSAVHGPALTVSNPWDEHVQNFHIPTNKSDNEPWRAFENGNDQHTFVGLQQGADLQVSQNITSLNTNQYLGHKFSESSGADGLQKLGSGEGGFFTTLPSHVASRSSFNQPVLLFMTEPAHTRQKSGNPFDIDSELEASNAFLDSGSLQDTLPGVSLPYVDGINESWFASSPVASQVPPSSPQLPNVLTYGPVASVGGNPFA